MDLFTTDPYDGPKKLQDFKRLLELEADYMASDNYLQNPNAPIVRKQALLFITKTLNQEFEQTTPKAFVGTVAITYFDRFFSRQPNQSPSWEEINLIAFSCLSLACKMTKIGFNFSELLNKLNLNSGLVADTELLILKVLEWRMLPITAFSFLEYFIRLLDINDPQSRNNLGNGAANHFVKPMCDAIEFSQFTPSIIAASAVALEASISGQFFDPRDVFAGFVNMDAMERCSLRVARDDMNHMIMTSVEAQSRRRQKMDAAGSSNPTNAEKPPNS